MIVRKHNIEFNVSNGDFVDFWIKKYSNVWEDSSFNFIDTLSRRNNFYDIGSHIGQYTLYVAATFTRVFSYEPDHVAYRVLSDNVDMNQFDNITLYNSAITIDGGDVYLQNSHLGNSETTIVNSPKTSNDISVKSIAGNTIFELLTPDDVCKIDIEGYEYELLTDANISLICDSGAHLLLSIHPTKHKPDELFNIITMLHDRYEHVYVCTHDTMTTLLDVHDLSNTVSNIDLICTHNYVK